MPNDIILNTIKKDDILFYGVIEVEDTIRWNSLYKYDFVIIAKKLNEDIKTLIFVETNL